MRGAFTSPFVMAAITVAALVLARPVPARAAEGWPQRSVKVMLPIGPGSGADVTARLLADALSRRWGVAVVVENRPGADGIVGVSAFLAAADDHTLMFTPTGTFTASPLAHETRLRDLDRLAPVARVTNTLIAIAVPAALGVGSLRALVASVAAQPGRTHWASTTGATDLVFSAFLRGAGLDMLRVPYRDGIQAINDLSEGRIEAYMSALTAILPQAGARIRIVAVSNRTRAPALPDVPTAAEAGYPALQYDGLIGFLATTAMPPAVRERIAADVQAVIDPAMAARIAATGQVVSPGGPAEFAAAIAEQSAAFDAVARSLNLRP